MKPFQILKQDGSPIKTDLIPDQATIERLYRLMVRGRHLDDKFQFLVSANRMGKYAQFAGQEASQICSAATLDAASGDWLAPMYRSTGAMITFGWPLHLAMLYWRSHPVGWRIPDDLNMMPIIIDISAQFPHAAGVAMGLKMAGKKNVCMTYIGEGGTSQGDTHAGINFAAATGSPAVFVIENNGWAISVPRSVQSKVDYLARRADGYGIPGHVVDGNDALACYVTAKQAVDHARAGNGPSLIENLTYRLRPHTTGDDPKAYRDESITKEWAETKDPIERLRKFMEKEKIWNKDKQAALMLEIETEFDEALAKADATPEPDPYALLENVLAKPTPAILEQQAILHQRIQAEAAQQ